MNETIKKIGEAFSDDRGAISNVLEEPINHVAVITTKAGSIRGNHYHPEQIQYVYLISGRYESFSKDLRDENAEVEKITVEAGSIVITPPMIAHAMKFTEDSVMLNLTTDERDPASFDKHTKKFELIKDDG
ncbi:cupin domain-containing protein [Candidatus Woesearchaeota archaeon]|nr:cupin domain-containing protein [Candidatus Woesearchaeota archaeon]